MGVIHVDDNTFDEKVMKSEIPVVVDFWAEWCMPCRLFGPIFEEASNKFNGKVIFAKVNTEESPDLANRFRIMSIPSSVFIKSGEEIHRNTGMLSEGALISLIKEKFDVE